MDKFSHYPVEDISTPATMLHPLKNRYSRFFRFEAALQLQKLAWLLYVFFWIKGK
jgi:hypothetical protein